MEFKLNCIPPKTTHQVSARIFKRKDGSMFVGHDNRGRETQGFLLALLTEYAPEKPIEGAIKLTVEWVYPWRSTETKKNKALGRIPCLTRPDCDNLSKFCCDCMTKLRFWNDDSQVYHLDFSKYYGEDVGIFIKIENNC